MSGVNFCLEKNLKKKTPGQKQIRETPWVFFDCSRQLNNFITCPERKPKSTLGSPMGLPVNLARDVQGIRAGFFFPAIIRGRAGIIDGQKISPSARVMGFFPPELAIRTWQAKVLR